MAAFDPNAAEVFVSTPDNFLASYKSVLLQVRRGPLTLPVLDRIESIVRSLRAREGGGAFIGVLEETADVASGEVRGRQMALFKELLRHPRSFAATVVPNETAKGSLLRTLMRMIAFANPRLGIFGTSIEAGRWLEKRVKLPALELTALIDWGRSRRPSIVPKPSSSTRMIR